MVTDQQALLLRRRIMEGKTQQASAAAAGMSARGARRRQSENVVTGEPATSLVGICKRWAVRGRIRQHGIVISDQDSMTLPRTP